MSKKKAIRYSAAKAREVVQFVHDFNKKNGRGGQAAASRKYKVGPLTIAKWLKSEEPKPSPQKAVKSSPQKAGDTNASLESTLARMTEIHDQMERLHSEMKKLYSSATHLSPEKESSVFEKALSGVSKRWHSSKKENPEVTIPAKMAKERRWTNKEGKTILATLIDVRDEVAVLKIKNGTVYRYPVAALSDKNREEIAALVS